MFDKLNAILNRYEYLLKKLEQPEIINNIEDYKNTSAELASLTDIVETYKKYLSTQTYMQQLQKDINLETDKELIELCKLDLLDVKDKLYQLENDLKYLLIPKNEDDDKNIIMEIRAGVGGDEACLFANDLFSMYVKYATQNNWEVKLTNYEEGGVCGAKEIVCSISGKDVYAKMKYEAGVHRVQRVPETETKGRIHTSTATVAILPERTAIEVVIDPKDVRVDLFHSGGKGGQNVNKVESAVRVTHIPTGIAVACQEERSQLMNKVRAFEILRAKLFDLYNSQDQTNAAQNKKMMLGTGDRSEKIRTYNYPQHRVTDHRINYSMFDLDKFMQGNIDEMIEQLRFEDRELQVQNI